MADGASAIIGIVAFGLQAVHKVYEIIDSIKDAPTDILALKHDAEQIGSLLLQLQQLRVTDSAVVPSGVNAAILMKLFEDALGEVESFVNKVAESRRDGKIRVKKLQWFLRGGRCEKLRGSLTSLKTSIIAIVAASTSQSVDAIQPFIIQLVEAFKRDHDSWVTRQAAEFANLQAATEERMAAFAHNQDRIYCILASSSEVIQPPSASCAPPAASESMSVPDIPRSVEVQSGGQTSQDISFSPRTSRPLSVKDLKLPLQCESRCECCCHDTRLTRATPYWCSSWFGNLYLPRSFFHWSYASCNVQTCRRTQKNRQIAKIKFFFPSWFIAVDMKIRLEAFPVHFCLQTPRRVRDTSPIFQCIMRMDIEGVRKLLVSGEASVNDVDGYGWGVLHWAARRIHYYSYEQTSEMLQLLTDEGAHIEWEEDMWHRTPLQLLQQSSPPQQYQESHIGLAHPLQIHIAGPIFHEDIIDSWEDWLERCDFPDVHRAVLTHRTRNMSLRDMLLGTAADINAPCRMGVTPLEWCIWMGIPNVLETLLQCGADVYEGCPLHLAASSGDVEALKLLVHAGADINLQDTDGATPLHMAAYYGKAEYVKELIRIGGDDLDLGALDHCYGNTALDIARAGRIKCEEMGWPTDDRDKIILALLELQASSGGRRMPEHSDVTNAYIEMVEDLCMPGSFPVD